MVNIITSYKPLLHQMMKLDGMSPRKVEIEPGTIINIWAARKTNPNKPNVVLLHGFAGDGILTWQFQVFALRSKYSVYVPDFLFFGDSYTDKPNRSPEFQAECVTIGLIKLGVVNCVVVGFSYGGMVGFKLAEMFSDLVESMVVTCSVMALNESISKACLDQIGFSWSDYLLPDTVEGVKVLLQIGSYSLHWFPKFVRQHYLKATLSNRKEQRELLEALVISGEKFKTHNYRQRIHLLWGANDNIFNMEIANNLKMQLGELATLESINKAGHLVLLERPCAYNRRLKKILATFTGKR